MHKQKIQRRHTVSVDDRRAVMVIARSREARMAAVVPHEAFIRNALKDRLGWPRKEPASEELKTVAREMAAHLVSRDKEAAAAKRAAYAAKEAADAAKAAAEIAEVEA